MKRKLKTLYSEYTTLPSTLSDGKTWSVNLTEEQEFEKTKKKVLRKAVELKAVSTHKRVIKPRNI
jgi:hypothetical protein